jgi:hypothetical protein
MVMEPAPGSSDELLARIDRDWKGFWLLVDQFDAGQMETPDASGWSLKDNLAHLAAWERYLVEHTIHHAVMGIDASTMATLDEAGLNALIRAHNRDRDLADVMADLRQAHRATVNTIAAMRFDDLLQPLDAAAPSQTLLSWVTGNTYEHYQEHAAMLLTLLEQQG